MKADPTADAAITVRPIACTDLDRINLRCWPGRDVINRLLAAQGTIGMAAWEGDTCVGMLHCYGLTLPRWESPDWPEWNAWWLAAAEPDSAPKRDLGLTGAAWAHACFHVGRTLAAAEQSDSPDPRYFGRGIATALCGASVQWAREHDCIAALAPGAPVGLPEFAQWTGHLPWTTYAKLGFRVAGGPEPADLPKWARGDCPPTVMAEVKAAVAAGRPPCDFHDRLMVLDLHGSQAAR